MPRYYTENWTETENLSLNDSLGIQLRGRAADPTDNNIADGRLYYNNDTNVLRLRVSGAFVNVATGVAGGGVPTWENIFALDSTFGITAGTWTITQSSANAIFTLNKTNVGAGAVITITNSGSGNDITGNAGNWSITAAGLATFATSSIISGTLIVGGGAAAGTVQSNGNFDLTLQTGNATTSDITIVDGANGNVDITLDGTGRVDINGTTEGNNSLVVAAGDVSVTLGSVSVTDNDNAASFSLTNNTLTTFGTGGASTGMALIRSTSLTTGTLLQLQLTEGTLAGGFYLVAFDATAAGNVFTIGEDGATTITGAGGSTMFTMTAGDMVLSDTSIALTDADDAASFSVTNNTATTANVVLFTGSGVFTGTGTTAFFRVTQSGATSGDVVNVQADGLTSGTAVRVGSTGTIVTTGALLELVGDSATTAAGLVRLTADALTTGFGVLVESTSVNLAAGQLLNINHTASGTIVAKTGQLIDIVSSRDNTAAAAISDDYDALSIIRTNINTNAGGTLNAAGSVLRLENVGTETAGTLADTVIGLEVVMTGGATQDGVGISLTHTGTTAGRAMEFVLSHTTLDGVIQITGNSVDTGRLIVADMNGLTGGIGLELTHTTSVITTGSVMRLTSTGVDTGTAQGTLLDLVSSAATAATVVALTADALTGGIGVLMSFDGLTTGEGVLITHTTSVVADGGSVFRVTSTGIDTGGATNGALVDFSSTAQAAGVVARLTANGLTTGSAFLVTSSGTITSAGEGLVNLVATGMTTGDALKIDLTEGTLTTGNYLNCYDDTGAASVFRIAENGATTILGAAGTILTVTEGDVVLSNGAMASAREQVTLGVGVAAIAVDSNVVEVTGDGGGNSVTTITGGVAGQVLVLLFVDGNVTIVDDNTHGANSIDIVGANTTFADDATLTLVFDGTSWYEIARSIND